MSVTAHHLSCASTARPPLHVSGTPAQVAELVARLINAGWSFPELPRQTGRCDWLISALPPAA